MSAGDHVQYIIARRATGFYMASRKHQQEFAELRIFDDDHNFDAWGKTVGNAMEYMSRYISAPR